MKMTDATARRGTGSTVTLTRKNSGAEHNPAPTTKRGKRRAARRGADAVLEMANADMLTELGVSE